MKNAAFLAVGLLLILLQGNLHRVLGPLAVHGVTPSLVLPLVLQLGVHEPSMARGALLTAALGYALDLFASAPVGLFTFVYVAIFVLARAAGVRLAAQTVLTQMSLALGFTIVEGAMVLVLLAIFGADAHRPLELVAVVLPHSVATAVVAPFVFRLAQRMQREGAIVARVAAGADR